MEELQATMADIKSALASVNAYLAYFQTIIEAEVENKKKKVDKKKNNIYYKERNNIYTKKDGQIVLSEDFAKDLTQEQINYYESLAKDFPKISMFEETLKYEEYVKLEKRFGKEYVTMTMSDLENYKFNNRYTSGYRTLISWLSRYKKH